MRPRFLLRSLCLLLMLVSPGLCAEREVLEINGHKAFLYPAPTPAAHKPWVWFAPTLNGISLSGRKFYFDALMNAGIAVAGYDLGEVRGAPDSTAKFTAFYLEMVRRGYSPKPVLLGQSRGGMMMLPWAVKNPDKLRAFAGIYPVFNLASWPLKQSKAQTLADFGMSEEQLRANLERYNPIEHLQGLIANRVPIFVVQGDSDRSVPYEENTKLLEQRYQAAGASITVKLIAGEGHKATPAFFECRELLDFLLKSAAAN